MNFNRTNIGHPRTQRRIKAGMIRAIEFGAGAVMTSSGRELVTIIHDRTAFPGLTFWRDCQDVTAQFVKALREVARS